MKVGMPLRKLQNKLAPVEDARESLVKESIPRAQGPTPVQAYKGKILLCLGPKLIGWCMFSDIEGSHYFTLSIDSIAYFMQQDSHNFLEILFNLIPGHCKT